MSVEHFYIAATQIAFLTHFLRVVLARVEQFLIIFGIGFAFVLRSFGAAQILAKFVFGLFKVRPVIIPEIVADPGNRGVKGAWASAPGCADSDVAVAPTINAPESESSAIAPFGKYVISSLLYRCGWGTGKALSGLVCLLNKRRFTAVRDVGGDELRLSGGLRHFGSHVVRRHCSGDICRQVGTMTKPDTRRADIPERLADHVLAHGLSASSLRPLAKAAGTSDRMLLYYFADKAEMITATLGVIAIRIMMPMEANKAPAPMPMEHSSRSCSTRWL